MGDVERFVGRTVRGLPLAPAPQADGQQVEGNQLGLAIALGAGGPTGPLDDRLRRCLRHALQAAGIVQDGRHVVWSGHDHALEGWGGLLESAPLQQFPSPGIGLQQGGGHSGTGAAVGAEWIRGPEQVAGGLHDQGLDHRFALDLLSGLAGLAQLSSRVPEFVAQHHHVALVPAEGAPQQQLGAQGRGEPGLLFGGEGRARGQVQGRLGLGHGFRVQGRELGALPQGGLQHFREDDSRDAVLLGVAGGIDDGEHGYPGGPLLGEVRNDAPAQEPVGPDRQGHGAEHADRDPAQEAVRLQQALQGFGDLGTGGALEGVGLQHALQEFRCARRQAPDFQFGALAFEDGPHAGPLITGIGMLP